MASNIAVYYRFDVDDVRNNTMRNAITGTYDATVTAETITPANFFIGKSALNMDNITKNQFFTMSSSLTIPQSGFSIAFWMASNNIGGGGGSTSTVFNIVSSNTGYNVGTYGLQMVVDNTTNNIRFRYFHDSASQAGEILSTSQLVNDNIWRHVLLTFTSANVVSLYINGKLNARATFSNYPFSTTYAFSYIGREATNAGGNFTGSIDDFRIYSYDITSENDINYLLYYPNFNIYTTSASNAELLGNTISNFYDQNNVNISQTYAPRTMTPGTITLISGKPNQTFDIGDFTASSTTYVLPAYCVFDPLYRNLYVCDQGSGKLERINMYTGVLNTIYTHTNVNSVAFDVSGVNYYLTGRPLIPQIDLSTNTFQQNINTNALTNTVFGLTDNSNNLFLAHATGIARINLSGSLPAATTTVITTTIQMEQMCFKPSSQVNIYAIDISNTFIYVINKTTNANYTITLPASLFSNNPNTDLAGLVFDSMENLYVACLNGNNNIYMIPYYVINGITTNTTLTTSQIVLYAGTSSFGYSGDGGPCINAQFMAISNLSIDAGDNLYICDSVASTIRKIVSGGPRKTNFMNMITNETGVVTKTASDLKTVYSGIYSIGGIGASIPPNYSNYVINNTSTLIETELQPSTYNVVDPSGLLIYYKFNTADTSGIQLANYSRGMPVLDASMNDARIVSSMDSVVEGGALRMFTVSTGTWPALGSLPRSSLLLQNNPSGFNRHGLSFGHWNSVAVSSSGLYVAGVGDFHNFYTNYNTNTNIFTQLYTVPTVELVGGTGTLGYTGDGGPVTKAQFTSLLGNFLFTPDGYYIANNNTIRFVNNQSIIRTVCGTNSASSTGNFGLATAATINGTYSIFQDISKNYIYIAERQSHVVRRIDKNGIIYPFCGTGTASSTGDGEPAIFSTINSPWGMAIDTSDNVYVCEDIGARIRMIDFSTNIITTLAGTGSAGFNDNVAGSLARFNRPLGICLDLSRNLYIADFGNNRIRKITAVNGVLNSSCIVTTICGTGTASSIGNGRLATVATVNQPIGVTFSNDYSYLYISEYGGFNIRAINMKAGIINRVFGTGVTGLATGNGGNPLLATYAQSFDSSFDPSGNVYFGSGDTSLGYVRRLTPLASFPPFSKQPYDQVWALYGLSWKYIAMSGTGQYQIAYMNNFGTYLSNGYGSINTWDYIADLSGIYTNGAALSYTGQYQSVIDIYGNIYVSSRYGVNSSWSQQFVNTRNTNFTPMPAKIACSFDGRYQVATAFRHQQVIRIGGTGTVGFSGDGGLATNARFGYETNIRFDSSNNLIVADGYNHRIRRIIARTGIINTIAGTGTPGFPAAGTATAVNLQYVFSVMVDISNNYYVSLYNGIVKVTGTALTVLGGSVTAGFSGDGATFSTSTGMYAPQKMCCDSFNNIYITMGSSNAAANRVRKITASTNVVSTICGTGTASSTGDGGLATAATINIASGVCCDSFNNIYIGDSGGNRIRRIDALSGIITTICGTGTRSSTGDGGKASLATTSNPQSLCIDRANNLYIVEYGPGNATSGNRVRQIRARNGILDGDCIITTYAGNGTDGSGGDNGLPTQVALAYPVAVSIDDFDNVYLVNNGFSLLYRATQFANVIVSSNYGQTWSDVTTNITGNIAFNNVAVSQTGQYMTATSLNGRIYRSTNFGASGSWAVTNSSIDNWGCVVVSSTGQYQVAAGYDMSGVVSTDFGLNWTANGMPNGNWSSLALAEDTNTLYAVSKNTGASGSTIYKNTAFNLPNSGLNSQFLTINNPILRSANWPTVNGVSFSFWCKSNFNSTNSRFFDFGNGLGVDNVVMYVDSNNIRTWMMKGAQSSYSNQLKYQINDNTWRHVCWTMTYDASINSIYTIYVNGVNIYQQSNQTFTFYPNAATRQFCYIGKSNYTLTDTSFNGVIDDFRVYNRVLSEREVFELYSASECIHYYKFDSDYNFNNTQLANYNTIQPVYDGRQYTYDPSPPIITSATTVSFGTYITLLPGITNMCGMAVTQNNKRIFAISNGSTVLGFSDYNTNRKNWNSFTSVTITSFNWTGVKASADGGRVVMCASSSQTVTGGLYYSTWNGTTYSALTTIDVSSNVSSRFYTGIELTANGNRLIAVSDYVYFATWNNSNNYINLTATNLAVGSPVVTYSGGPSDLSGISQKYNMFGGIACNADGSRIAYANSAGEIYFATWNGSTYATPVLVAELDPYSTGMAMSCDGNLLFYSNVSDFSQKIFYSIWNGTTYTVQTELSFNYVNTPASSSRDGLPQITPAGSLYLALSYDMSTLYISTNNNSAYLDTVLPRSRVGNIHVLPLTYTNTSTMTKIVGTNSLVVQRQNTANSFIPYFTPFTQPFFVPAIGLNSITISDDNSRVVILGYNGPAFYATLDKRNNLYSAFVPIPITLIASSSYICKMTADGSRLVLAFRTTGVYFSTWLPDQNNYSNMTITLGGATQLPGALDVTADGSRIFTVSANGIYYANWDGTNYSAWIYLGVAGSAILSASIGCSGDGMRIVYVVNYALSVFSWALWNGYTYVIQGTVARGTIQLPRTIRLNYDGSILFHNASNADTTAASRYNFWNGSGYSASVNVPTAAIPASLDSFGLNISQDLKTITVGGWQDNGGLIYQTAIDLKAPTQVSALTIPDTKSYIKSIGTFTQPFTTVAGLYGISITQNGLRAVVVDATMVYVSTFNGSTWSAFTTTSATTTNVTFIDVKLTADGSRGVTISRGGTGFAYLFTWTGSTYSALTQTLGATSTSYQAIDMTTDGLRIFTIDQSFVRHADWNGTNYGAWTNTIFVGSAVQTAKVACSADGYRLVYCANTTTLNYAVWNGGSYVLQSTFGSITLGVIRNIRFSFDGNYVFYSQQSAVPNLFYSVWTGTGFGNTNTISLTGIPSTNSFPLAVSYDLTKVYSGGFDGSVTNLIYQVPINLTTVTPNTTGLTFSFWVKSIASPDYGGLISLQSIYGWILMYILGDTVFAAINEQRATIPANIFPTNINKNSVAVATIQQYTWNHIAWTIQQVNTNYDVSGAGIWTVYLNGNSVYQNTNQIYPYPGTRTTNFVGYNGQLSTFMNGNMDDYRAYNRVLSAREIQNIYINSPNVTYEKPLSLPAGLQSEVGLTYTFTAGDAIPTLLDFTTIYRDLSAIPIQNGAYVLSNSANLVNAGLFYWWKAFDNNSSTFTHTLEIYNSATGVYTGTTTTTIQGVGMVSGEWQQIQIPYSLQVSSYIITIRSTNPERFPGTWYLVGSNNGADWFPIDYNVGITYTTDTVTFTPNQSNTNYYSYFRFVWIIVGGTPYTTARTSLNLVAIQFSGAARTLNYFYFNNAVKTYLPRLQSNNFTTWRLLVDNTSRNYNNVGLSDEGTVLFSSRTGVIFRSTDYGISYTSSVNTTHREIAVSRNGNNAVICRPSSTLFYSTNGGASFTAGVTTSTWQMAAMNALGTTTVFGTNGNGNFYSTNGGQTVTASTGGLTTANMGVAISSQGQFALTTYATTTVIYRSTDTGATLSTSSSPSTTWNSVAIEDTGIAFATTTTGLLYRSTDFGVNWTQILGVPSGVSTVTMSTSSQYVLISCPGSIYFSNDYGLTFSLRTLINLPSALLKISRDGRFAAAVNNNNKGFISRL